MNEELQVIETEHGKFTNNELTGQTAEEVYQEWLESKNKPQEPPTNKTEIYLLQKQVKQLTEEKQILAQNIYDMASILEVIIGTMLDEEVAGA